MTSFYVCVCTCNFVKMLILIKVVIMLCQCWRSTSSQLSLDVSVRKRMSQYIHYVVTTLNECQIIVVTRLEQLVVNRLLT